MLEPGADVIALGFGQAFTDLVALVTEGRGGRFETRRRRPRDVPPERRRAGAPRRARGAACPYRSKLDYRLQGPKAPMPKFLDDVAVERLLASPHPLQFRRDILPLVAKEVGWTYYHELFNAHGERTTCDWDAFAERYSAPASERTSSTPSSRRRCPTRSTASRSRPSTARSPGCSFDRRQELHDHVSAHVVADVARRTEPGLQRRPRRVHRPAVDVRHDRAHRGVRQGRPALARHRARARGGSRSSCTTPAARRRPACASCWPSPTSGWSASSVPARRSRPTRSSAASSPAARATTRSSPPAPTSTPASPPRR